MTLTEHQQDAYDTVHEMVTNGKKKAKLSGYAGTGKTFLTGALVDGLIKERVPVYACAPTHKAAHVLQEKMPIEATTIHSFLGLQLKPDGRGGYKLVRKHDHDLPSRGVVFVDEASMIGTTLWKFVQEASHLKWVFIGDPAQLPPVNEDPSPIFSLPGADLEEVVRQAAGNPIIDLATRVRNHEPIGFATRFEGDIGIAITHDLRGFLASAAAQFKAGADARILAYRNETVGRYNFAMRELLHGTDLPRFMAGDRLMARETWFDEVKAPVIRNSAEMTVLDAKVETLATLSHGEWKIWRITADVNGHERTFPVLHEEEENIYRTSLSDLKRKCRAGEEQWRKWYEFREMFAEVDYAFAMTVHKSQGSTFETVYIDYRDISTCRADDRQACIYVAVTRPAKRLAVLT